MDALFDSGSQANLIAKELVNKLGLYAILRFSFACLNRDISFPCTSTPTIVDESLGLETPFALILLGIDHCY